MKKHILSFLEVVVLIFMGYTIYRYVHVRVLAVNEVFDAQMYGLFMLAILRVIKIFRKEQ